MIGLDYLDYIWSIGWLDLGFIRSSLIRLNFARSTGLLDL